MAVVFKGVLRSDDRPTPCKQRVTVTSTQPTLEDDDLRYRQDYFLTLLETRGFFKRNKDGWSVSLFEPGSPTALQMKQRVYPEYRDKVEAFIHRFDTVVDLTEE